MGPTLGWPRPAAPATVAGPGKVADLFGGARAVGLAAFRRATLSP
jgi:hypothetical protein